MKINSITNPFK